MRRFEAQFLALCLVSCGAGGTPSQTARLAKDKAHEPGVELERNYEVLEKRGDKEVVTGSCHLLVRREASRLILEESCTADAHGKSAGWSSTVTYETEPVPHPVRAIVTTTFRKAMVMTGRVDFKQDAAEVETTLHADSDGQPMEMVDVTRETHSVKGRILILSTLEVIAPLMLGQAGTLKDLVIAELPDDIDEPVHFTQGCVLTRSEPDADGDFTMRAYYEEDGDTYFVARFDPGGLLASVEIDDEVKMVPSDKD